MSSIQIARILIAAFFAVCFLQSGIDKVVDRKGNLEWLTGHFSKTFFARGVPLLLSVITLFELAAGVVCALAVPSYLIPGFFPDAARIGLTLVGASLLMLFTGQRLAKDYAGAMTLACYFILAIIGLAMN